MTRKVERKRDAVTQCVAIVAMRLSCLQIRADPAPGPLPCAAARWRIRSARANFYPMPDTGADQGSVARIVQGKLLEYGDTL